MIDNISEPGSWARELAMRPKRCDWCVNYRYSVLRSFRQGDGASAWCALGKPLGPCAHYQREPGADDDEN